MLVLVRDRLIVHTAAAATHAPLSSLFSGSDLHGSFSPSGSIICSEQCVLIQLLLLDRCGHMRVGAEGQRRTVGLCVCDVCELVSSTVSSSSLVNPNTRILNCAMHCSSLSFCLLFPQNLGRGRIVGTVAVGGGGGSGNALGNLLLFPSFRRCCFCGCFYFFYRHQHHRFLAMRRRSSRQ